MKYKLFLTATITLLFGFVLATAGAPASAARVATPNGGPWSDNFDGYPTGQNLHGVGGWKGWDNNPAFTAFTTNVQARSAPNSVDIAANSDLVHEYTANSGLWTFTTWQYVPGNFQGTPYLALLNQHVDGGPYNWSLQVNFNSATGLMVDDGASGATMPFVTDQWVKIQVEIDLDNDTQAFYYNNSLFYTGTWSGHVSGGGITAIGAVNLFANASTSVYYDDMSLRAGPRCPDDELEDNDGFFQATGISLPYARSGLQVCAGDDDYFSFIFEAGATVTVDAAFSHVDGDLDIFLHDPGRNQVANSVSVTDDEQIIYEASQTGVYYLRVHGFANAENSYDLYVTGPSTYLPVVVNGNG